MNQGKQKMKSGGQGKARQGHGSIYSHILVLFRSLSLGFGCLSHFSFALPRPVTLLIFFSAKKWSIKLESTP